MFLQETWSVLRQAAAEWVEDKASQLGAALAFYSILSLAPLLVIAIAIAGFVFGEQAARGEIVGQIRQLVGMQGAEAIQTMLAHAHHPEAGIIATTLGLVTLLFGASGVFNQLRDSLNTIWGVQPSAERGVWPFVRDRLFPFLLVLGTGCLLLASLVVSTTISAAARYLQRWVDVSESFWHGLNFVVLFTMVFLLFALIYKVLPATHVAWRDVWLGAAITAVLFAGGKLLLDFYLSMSTIAAAYGAGVPWWFSSSGFIMRRRFSSSVPS